MRWAGFLVLVAACGGGERCEPEGTRIAGDVTIGALALDDEHVYATTLTGVERWPRGGGESQLLYAALTRPVLAYPVIRVDADHVYFVETCEPPPCAALRRVPRDGGAVETIDDSRVFDLALGDTNVYFTTSDERGLQTGEPDGVVWRWAKDGSAAPVQVATGLVHLREVLVNGDSILVSVASSIVNVPDLERVAQIVELPDTPLVTLDGSGNARPLTPGLSGGSLYFAHRGAIYRDMTVLAEPENPPYATAAVGDTVYWVDPGRDEGTTDDDPGEYFCGAVRTPGGAVAGGQPRPHVLAADTDGLFWATSGVSGEGGALVRSP